MHAFSALRTLQVDPAFLDFNPHILLQAIQAELVTTIPQLGKLVRRSLTAKITYLDSLTSGQ
jgi:hypothetical protein